MMHTFLRSDSVRSNLVLMGTVFAIGVACADTPTGWWTGGGSSYSTLDAANWEGGAPEGGTLSFSKGGSRAELGEDLSASKLVFDTPDDVPEFTLAPLASAPDAKLSLSSGSIAVNASASGVAHTNTIAVPVEAPVGTLTVNVANAADGLVFNSPISRPSSATSGNVKINTTGPGNYFFNSPQGPGACTIFHGGTVYVKDGALGEYMQANPSSAPLYIHYAGGTNDVTCTYTKVSGYGFGVYFDEGTTNYLGFTQIQNTYGTPFQHMANSHTTFGSSYCPIDSCWRLANDLHADSEVVFKGTVSGRCTYTSSAEQQMHVRAYNATAAHRARLVFAMPKKNKSKVQAGLFLAGPMTVRFDEDFAFDADTSEVETPISIMYNNNQPMGVIVDLNGHSQRFGSLRTPPADKEYGWENYISTDYTAYMTSAIPATVYVRQNGRVNSFAWSPTFRGALSLVKEGTNTLALSGTSPMTGTVTVADGRLEFSGTNGKFTKVSGVAVSGGTFAIDSRSRLPEKIEYRLSGGKLEIAAGIRLRASALYVSDGAGGWIEKTGIFSAANLPDFISGEGLISAHPGFCMVIK